MITTDILVMLVAVVGMSMSTIGVVIALFIRLDGRVAGVDARVGDLQRDNSDLKAAVSRIEGYLAARDGFGTAGADPAPAPSVSIEIVVSGRRGTIYLPVGRQPLAMTIGGEC